MPGRRPGSDDGGALPAPPQAGIAHVDVLVVVRRARVLLRPRARRYVAFGTSHYVYPTLPETDGDEREIHLGANTVCTSGRRARGSLARRASHRLSHTQIWRVLRCDPPARRGWHGNELNEHNYGATLVKETAVFPCNSLKPGKMAQMLAGNQTRTSGVPMEPRGRAREKGGGGIEAPVDFYEPDRLVAAASPQK